MASAEALGVLDVEEVLRDAYGLEGHRGRRNQWSSLCVAHEDSRPSMDVDLVTGYWNCFSCSAGGDLVELGVYIRYGDPKTLGKKKAREARLAVRKSLGSNDIDARLQNARVRLKRLQSEAAPTKAHPKASWAPTVPRAGSYSDGPLDYMVERGFKKSLLRKFGVRYANRAVLQKDPKNLREDENPNFEISNVIAIPVFDTGPEPVMWTYRSTPESEQWMREGAKYIHTPGVDKQQFWFGKHMIEDFDEVAVTEGPLDALWLWQWGIPALANFGTHLKNERANFKKIDYLCNFRKVTLFFDRDASGVMSAESIGEMLHKRGVQTNVALYPSFVKATDPQELDRLDVQIVYWRAKPYLKWAVGDRLRPSSNYNEGR